LQKFLIMVFKIKEIKIGENTYKDVFGKVKRFDMDLISNTGVVSLDVSETNQFKIKVHAEVEIDWKGKPQIQKDLQQSILKKLKAVGIEPE